MYEIAFSIVTSLFASLVFWMMFTKIPEIIRYRKMRPIVEYDMYIISFNILFFLQMAFDNHGMRPEVSQVKIKANVFSEEEYDLMLQNKCLNESYLYDENKDYLIPIGNELDRLSKKIVKEVESLSFYHNFMTCKEIMLLKKIKESITRYSYDDNAKIEFNSRVFFPTNPNISFMAKTFKTINNYFYELNNIIFKYKYLDKDLLGYKFDLILEKSRVFYEQCKYEEAYKYARKSSEVYYKKGFLFMYLFKLGKTEKALVYLEDFLNEIDLRLVNIRDLLEDSYDNIEVHNLLESKRGEEEINELVRYFHDEEELKQKIRKQLYRIKENYERKLKG